MQGQLEGVAEQVLRDAGHPNDRPMVDIAGVAKRLGLTIRDGGRGCRGLLIGNTIIVDETMCRARWNFAVAHELAHWEATRSRRRNSEQAADYVAAALLMPRAAMKKAVKAHGPCLGALMPSLPHSPGEALARRLVATRRMRAVILHPPNTAVGWFTTLPYWSPPTALEFELVGRALDARAHVRGHRAVAYFYVEDQANRVVLMTTRP